MTFTTPLFIYHTKLIINNCTTKENMKGLFVNPFGNIYKRNVQTNCKNVLCPRMHFDSILKRLKWKSENTCEMTNIEENNKLGDNNFCCVDNINNNSNDNINNIKKEEEKNTEYETDENKNQTNGINLNKINEENELINNNILQSLPIEKKSSKFIKKLKSDNILSNRENQILNSNNNPDEKNVDVITNEEKINEETNKNFIEQSSPNNVQLDNQNVYYDINHSYLSEKLSNSNAKKKIPIFISKIDLSNLNNRGYSDNINEKNKYQLNNEDSNKYHDHYNKYSPKSNNQLYEEYKDK